MERYLGSGAIKGIGAALAARIVRRFGEDLSLIHIFDELLMRIDGEAVDRAIKIGACNIYHGCVHNMLYEKNEGILKGLYKAASFVVQAIYFKQTGTYIRHQRELSDVVLPEEKAIVDTFLSLKNEETVDFLKMSEALFEWAKKWIGEQE